MHPFIIGEEYGRPRLLDFLGSRQTQSGVLWGAREPGCLICTSGGRSGKKAGYSDEMLADGTWWYFGQGLNGDQSLSNSANARLSSKKMSILLFSTREPTSKEVLARGGYGKFFAFRGEFNVVGFEPFFPCDGARKGDQLWRFRLAPVGDWTDHWREGEDSKVGGGLGLKEIQAHLGLVSSEADRTISLREYRRRSVEVHRYAMLRANGFCEGCGLRAPFARPDGRPFLEVHHMTRLADDGPDLPGNVAALCPNCHRRAHFSRDKLEFGCTLREHVLLAEALVASGEMRAPRDL